MPVKTIIVNDRSVVVGKGETQALNQEQHRQLLEWVELNVLPHKIKTINTKLSSYRLKHIAEKNLGFYVSNLDMKVAMAQLGFDRSPNNHINHCYNVSKKFKYDSYTYKILS